MSSVIDSKHQELSTDEIIAIASVETGNEYTPEQIKASVAAEAHENGAIVLRQGNTLFVVHKAPNQKGMGVFRALNADTAQNYIQNVIMFLKAIKLLGYQNLVTEYKDPTINNILKIIARNPPMPGMGYAIQRTGNGGFRATINLGQEQQGGLPNARAERPVQGGL